VRSLIQRRSAPIPATVKASFFAKLSRKSRTIVVSILALTFAGYFPRSRSTFDTFRLDRNGKIVEHWDVLQIALETSANNDTMSPPECGGFRQLEWAVGGLRGNRNLDRRTFSGALKFLFAEDYARSCR
jgi:hypothetical protein